MLLTLLLAIGVLWTAIVAIVIGACMSAARGDRVLPGRSPERPATRSLRFVA